MADIVLPPLGDTVDEARVTTWLKEVGDTVAIDEPLLSVETDKVETEIPALTAGILSEHRVAEGETVAVGAVLGVIRTSDTEVALTPPPPATMAHHTAASGPESPSPGGVPAREAPPASAPATAGPRRLAPRSEHVRTPVVRRLLAERGTDAAAIVGSGASGRITRADVLATETVAVTTPMATVVTSSVEAVMVPAPRPFHEDPRWQPFSRIRKITGERMLLSATTIPQVTTVIKVDYDNVDRARQAHKKAFRARTGRSLTYLPFVSVAVTNALTDFPLVNATVKGDGLIVHPEVHLGVAVDLDFRGLVVPVVRNAQELRLDALATRISDLAERARDKSLVANDTSGSTFTITNPGGYGTHVGTPLVNPPEVAILCLEGISDEAVVARTADGTKSLTIHPVGHLSLSWDHRAMDGAYAAAFLAKVRSELETRDWSAHL